jgi:tetratricopeptide (TPR) repeat protein
MNEYLTIQRNLGDRPESYLNQGIVLAATGKTADAEQAYLFGLKRFPAFVAYYGNLADLYRAENNEGRAKEYLDKGLSIQPDNAELHYAAALWYERKKDRVSGLREFKKAVDLKFRPMVLLPMLMHLHSSQNTNCNRRSQYWKTTHQNKAMILLF